MKLSEFFHKQEILKNAEFVTLGPVYSNFPGTLAYCDTEVYLKKALTNSSVSCVITKEGLAAKFNSNKGMIASAHPRVTFYRLHHRFFEHDGYGFKHRYGQGMNCKIHPTACISEKVKIGNNVTISENAVIKDNVIIGDGTFIDSGAIIGSEGLLYYSEESGTVFVKHAGGVEIGRNVTILSKAVISKSVHESYLTRIDDHSIIGVSTNIGHEAQVGKNCVFSSNCVVARAVEIDNGVIVGPSVVIREHVTVGENARIRLGSVVIKDVPSGASVSGNFAFDHNQHLKSYVKKAKNR
jgi:UDP-3-O-[3-hydroxymyristoyl] glucosamine N-acyltransferase